MNARSKRALLSIAIAIITFGPGLSLAEDYTNLELALAQRRGIGPAEARAHVEAVFSALGEELKFGRSVTVPRFGKFHVTQRQGKVNRDAQTGAEVVIPAKRFPRFSSSDVLKEAVNSVKVEAAAKPVGEAGVKDGRGRK